VSAQLYLRRESEQYSREVGEIKQRNAAYQRGVVSGEPIEQNAAALYRLALPHFSVWRGQDKILADAINAADAGHGATALIRERCAEIRSERIRQALSSTRCDWQLGFALDQLNADFAEKLDGLRLARCLVVSGHDAASAGDRRQALSSYLQTIAVGCDLGMGDESMCVLGGASVTLGLTAIARLVMRTDDRAFLRDVAHRVSMFEGRWPDPAMAAPSVPIVARERRRARRTCERRQAVHSCEVAPISQPRRVAALARPAVSSPAAAIDSGFESRGIRAGRTRPDAAATA